MADLMDDAALRAAWEALPGNAQEVLHQLCKYGPTYDGDLISKSGRDVLLENRFAAKIIMGKDWVQPRTWKKPRPECEWGFQAATYLGAHVYKQGVVEPRKDVVRKLVGNENVKP